ncbi:MAG: lipocalin family protein [Anaerovoracaceae bacterium]|jgi:hypothetical protein
MKVKMKKLLAAAACLVIGIGMMCLVGCGDKYADSPYVGTWKAVSAEVSGFEVSMKTVGLEMTLTLEEDGSCTVDAGDNSGSGDWEETDSGFKVKDSSGDMNFKVGDDKKTATVEYSGATLKLKKQ